MVFVEGNVYVQAVLLKLLFPDLYVLIEKRRLLRKCVNDLPWRDTIATIVLLHMHRS